MNISASLLTLLLGVACGVPLLSGSATATPTTGPADGRVVILGFDGADGRTAAELMDAGQLPNLAKLRETGTFAPLGTTTAAESPVSWAALNSGRNPSETGIVGFVRREIGGLGPMPTKALSIDGESVALEDLPEPPAATGMFGLSGPKLSAALGGGAFLFFLIVFMGLLRLKAGVSFVLAAILGGVGAWVGLNSDQKLPPRMQVVQNPVAAPPFWELAAAAGVQSVVLDAAQAWDRKPVDGARVLCGLGVPDARGQYISYFVYTTDDLYFDRKNDKDTDTGNGGKKFRVDERDGKIVTELWGPPDFAQMGMIEDEQERLTAKLKSGEATYKESGELRKRETELKTQLKDLKDSENAISLPLEVTKNGDGTATVSINGEAQTLREGQWSDWYHPVFEMSMGVKAHSLTRVKILTMDEPFFELYVNALEIDPANPPFWQPVSQPSSFSQQLSERFGSFETVGWSCMTHPFKDKIIDPITFMEDIEFTMKWRENMTFEMLGDDDWRLFMSCLSTPDRVQHMMYQFYDEGHPLYDAEQAAQEMVFFGETIQLKDAIPAIYRQVDRIVGRVVDEYLREGDTLLVGADHGFQSFRYQVHINNWLVENGYMVLKDPYKKGKSKVLDWYVDWEQTKAYSLGLGTVYVNLEGREPNGIVDPADKRALMEEIRERLMASEDADGTKYGSEVYFAEDIHDGPFLDLEGDMFFSFNPTYRVSWGTASGGISMKKQDDGSYVPGPTIVDNDRMWSGDHISVDPVHVKGMFFSNAKFEVPEGGVHLMHIAPTALSLLGVDVPAEMDLPPLK